jgi:hypothetical protein
MTTTAQKKNMMLHFTIVGTTPLLMSSPKGMEQSSTAPLRKAAAPTPADDAEQRAYRFPDNTLAFPAVGIRNAILSGAKGLRITKRAAGPVLAACLMIRDGLFPVLDMDGEPLTEYEIDSRRVVIKNHGGIIRNRPSIPNWQIKGAFIYDDWPGPDGSFMKVVQQAFLDAGRVVGIGDYRVEKKGWFGCFIVAGLEVEIR